MTKHDELIARLGAHNVHLYGGVEQGRELRNPDGPEAAALLTKSLSQVESLTEALRPFAAFDDGRAPEHLPITQGSSFARKQLTIGDCRRAKAAIDSLLAKETGK